MARADVTVRGAGIFGLSVAWACARRGARVLVIDPGGVAGGASGGIVGALAPHVPENWNEKKAFQFAALDAGASFWSDIQDAAGADPGYRRTGRVQPILEEKAIGLAQARSVTAQTLWAGRYAWTVTSDAGAWPVPSPTGLYIHDTLTARLHPRRATHALALAVQSLGGRVVQADETEGTEVWATGVHDLDAMSAAAGRIMGNGVKGQAILLDHAVPDVPQLFADALHFVPHADGTLAIGSTSERDFAAADTTDGLLDALHSRACALVPTLATAPVLARWAGVRPRARSRAPVLGSHPLRPGAYIANGGFKIGFGMAPQIGEVLADLILEGVDAIPESFKPEPLEGRAARA